MKRAPTIVVQFVHLHGPLKGQIQEFTEPVISIGRHPDSSIRFPADLAVVSRKHAEITRDGNRFKLADLSTNGTYVNGKRAKEAYLKNGDVLTFAEGGPKVSFLMQMREEQEEAAPVSEVVLEAPVKEEIQAPRKEPAVRPRAVLEEPEIASQPVSAPLVFQYGPTLRSFKQLPVNIGKHPQCQFSLDHPGLLDMHAQILYAQSQYWVKDLTGRSLVQVNGHPVGLKPHPLKTDDLLVLSPQGPTFRFLGEGRLAEVEEALPESPDSLSPQRDQGLQGASGREKSDRESKSIFKRLFK
jgi:pSer/pThr/pTyr-binding forkhead associated (FHA) protein